MGRQRETRWWDQMAGSSLCSSLAHLFPPSSLTLLSYCYLRNIVLNSLAQVTCSFFLMFRVACNRTQIHISSINIFNRSRWTFPIVVSDRNLFMKLTNFDLKTRKLTLDIFTFSQPLSWSVLTDLPCTLLLGLLWIFLASDLMTHFISTHMIALSLIIANVSLFLRYLIHNNNSNF